MSGTNTQHNTINGGFTLVELLITMVIAVILATVAVPSFSSYIDNQRVRAGAQDLYSALQYARSEAVKRNADVVVASTDWAADGWSVSADGNVIRQHEGLDGLTVVNSSSDRLVFESNGRLAAKGSQRIELCDTAREGRVSKRRVEIGPSGQPRIGLDGDCSN